MYIYSRSDFLDKYHEKVLDAIKENQYIIETGKHNQSFVKVKNKIIKIPGKPKLGDLDINKVKGALYMIS